MLIKLLQKYGKLEKFDFLYHKKGPFTGQPRGYCFATYEKHCEAENAIKSLNGKHALSRKIHAQWASANNLNQFEPKTKVKSDSKPLNSDLQANWSVNQKIVAIEKKLGKMKETENEERNISDTVPRLLRSCGTNSLILHQGARDVKVSEVNFNPDFIVKMLPKLDLEVLQKAAENVGHSTVLPKLLNENFEKDDDLLKRAHHVLLEVDVINGELICPETGKKFPINDGIPNMLLNEDEV
ncbi:Multifunctional methyltransferase subunit TRM112-like protein [Nymphon striatum]|nr:Multifunctional methyltransferase subunit TRM112-like protein [Nymphon striatum]